MNVNQSLFFFSKTDFFCLVTSGIKRTWYTLIREHLMNDFSLFPRFSSFLDYIGSKLPTKFSYLVLDSFESRKSKWTKIYNLFWSYDLHFKCSSACFNCDSSPTPPATLFFWEKQYLLKTLKILKLSPIGWKCIFALILFDQWLEHHFIHLLLLAVIDKEGVL